MIASISINEKVVIAERHPTLERQPGVGRDHAFHPLRIARVVDETADARSFVLDVRLILLSFWITFRGTWEKREKKF